MERSHTSEAKWRAGERQERSTFAGPNRYHADHAEYDGKYKPESGNEHLNVYLFTEA
ncbi:MULTISPECIES: hypothetical protein [Pirellulaceae]|uniref:hypothetical protein n=1 Tax=Pirellulaceae TaxID=2691357 RepID=UPI001304F70A|nr:MULTISPECIES: hypothetical protein [Pirellulaceae]